MYLEYISHTLYETDERMCIVSLVDIVLYRCDIPYITSTGSVHNIIYVGIVNHYKTIVSVVSQET